MEVLRVRFDRLMAPFQPSCQEPRQRQHHPPNARRHAEEVQDHEKNRAQLVFGALGDGADGDGPVRPRGVRFLAGDRVARNEAHNVRRSHHQVADGQVDDGPFGVPKTVRINAKGAHGE